MKKTIMALMLILAGYAQGAVPQVEWSVDSQKPAATWTLTAFAGATPLVRVDLLQNGEAWYPSSDWSGIFWYGTNSDWNATSIVSVAGTFATSNSYIDFQCTSNTFGSNGTFYGGITMTNTTQTFEWGRGTLTVKNSGGISASGILDLRGAGTSVSGGLLTKVGAVIGLTSNAVQTAAAPLTNGLLAVEVDPYWAAWTNVPTLTSLFRYQNAYLGGWLQMTNGSGNGGAMSNGTFSYEGNAPDVFAVHGGVGSVAQGLLLCKTAPDNTNGTPTPPATLYWGPNVRSWAGGPTASGHHYWYINPYDSGEAPGMSFGSDGLIVTNTITATDGFIGHFPQTNHLGWSYMIPGTNWCPLTMSATGILAQITTHATSGGSTGTIGYKYWTNGFDNVTILGTMPCTVTAAQSNFTYGIPVGAQPFTYFPSGATQQIIFGWGIVQ